MATPKDPRTPDPWANFPGGNPFGPNGPFGAGGPFAGGGDPFQNLDAWLRSMGVDPADFRKMADEMQRNLGEALKSMGQDPSKSFVSGFSVKVGPDGKPTFNTFGNKPQVKPNPAGPGKGIPSVVANEREPLTDVIEDARQVAITMELPGVEKKDINVHMTDDELEISVDNELRKYHKRVRLPTKVDPKTTKATYTNGILDVTVQKRSPGKSGMKISVE
ncbi:MAG: archaeal heat shock protein Hsp20 [Thermoplasmatota archaeon]